MYTNKNKETQIMFKAKSQTSNQILDIAYNSARQRKYI